METIKKKEKSELERVKKFMYDIKYWLTTHDKLKIMVEICCVGSVSPVDCWQWFVFFWEERNKLYETDVSDLEYTMKKVRDYIERNFKTELD